MENLLLDRQEFSRLRVRRLDAASPGSPQRTPVAGTAAVQQSLMAADFH